MCSVGGLLVLMRRRRRGKISLTGIIMLVFVKDERMRPTYFKRMCTSKMRKKPQLSCTLFVTLGTGCLIVIWDMSECVLVDGCWHVVVEEQGTLLWEADDSSRGDSPPSWISLRCVGRLTCGDAALSRGRLYHKNNFRGVVVRMIDSQGW